MRFTIGAVNFNTSDWAKLLVESIRRNSSDEHEIIIVDNSDNLGDIPGVTILKPGGNIGHGAGLDMAIHAASNEYFLALDIDAHILRPGWERDLLNLLAGDAEIVGAEGGPLKPYRPCVSFFRTDYFLRKGHSFESVPISCKGGFMTIDVGVFFALRTLHDGREIIPLKVGDSAYENVWGDTYWLNGEPTFYHNWYSSRFSTGADVIDGRTKTDFETGKASLFRQVYG